MSEAMMAVAKYRCVDREHNSYTCEQCGHIAEFEADGPKENGWVFCPHCGYRVAVEEADEDA